MSSSLSRWKLPIFDAKDSLTTFLHSEHILVSTSSDKTGRITYRQFNAEYRRFCKEWDLIPINLLCESLVSPILDKFDLQVVDEVWTPEHDAGQWAENERHWYIVGIKLAPK